jgi:integral membrane sensor domain MASE1
VAAIVVADLQLRCKPLFLVKCRQMRQMYASAVFVYILLFVYINMNYMYIPPPRSRVELAETMRQASLSHIL